MSNEYNNFHLNGFETEDSPDDRWMMTFADLLSLLLVFFILIYATTSVKKGQWDKLKDAMGDSFKPTKIIENDKHVTNLHATKITINKGTDIDYLLAILESKIQENAFLKKNIVLKKDGNNLIISVNGPNFFEGNSPVLTEDSSISLFVIGDVVQRIKNKIEVFGYIDENIKSTDMDKWKLALSRVVKVATSMREQGNLSKLEAAVKNERQSLLDDNSLNRIDIIIRPYIYSDN